ncbi:MAG: chemotaxis protein CheW [bacterium]|nr:chemotaxis protein CheW [bacterium]
MVPGKVAGEGQYLTFKLDDEVYALEITKVREVLDYTRVTKVPRTPEFMKGVINLRGGVVPVVDLRLKFGMPQAGENLDTCIIIADITVDDEHTLLGALADQVREVIELDPSQIEPPPKIGTRLDTGFIMGMGKHEDQFIIILDIEKIFSAGELAVVRQASGAGNAAAAESASS